MKAFRALAVLVAMSVSAMTHVSAQPAPGVLDHPNVLSIPGAPTHAPELYSAAPGSAPVIIQTTPSGGAKVDGGGVLGSILQYVALLLGTPLGLLAAAYLKRAFDAAGIKVSQDLLDKFQAQITNGVALAAHEAQADLTGKLQFEVKDQIAARVLTYVQDHGAETAKGLGFDPNDPKFIEAVQARALKVMNDAASTPPAAVAVAAIDPAKPAV